MKGAGEEVLKKIWKRATVIFTKSSSNGFDALRRRRTKTCLVVRAFELSRFARAGSPYALIPTLPRIYARVRVNYVSCEMSNCSPYRKIYNSARCGKHYVLSGPSSSTFSTFRPSPITSSWILFLFLTSTSCSHFCRFR